MQTDIVEWFALLAEVRGKGRGGVRQGRVRKNNIESGNGVAVLLKYKSDY